MPAFLSDVKTRKAAGRVDLCTLENRSDSPYWRIAKGRDVEPSNGIAADGVQRNPAVPLFVLVSLMELTRVELATSGLQSRRSPN